MFSFFRRKPKSQDYTDLKNRLFEISNSKKDTPVSALRKIMSSIDTVDLIRRYESDLVLREDPRAQAEYLKNVHELKDSEHVIRLFNDLMVEQIKKIALETESWEETIAGRGTLNGIKLVWETIKELSVKYEELQEKLRKPIIEEDNHNYN